MGCPTCSQTAPKLHASYGPDGPGPRPGITEGDPPGGNGVSGDADKVGGPCRRVWALIQVAGILPRGGRDRHTENHRTLTSGGTGTQRQAGRTGPVPTCNAEPAGPSAPGLDGQDWCWAAARSPPARPQPTRCPWGALRPSVSSSGKWDVTLAWGREGPPQGGAAERVRAPTGHTRTSRQGWRSPTSQSPVSAHSSLPPGPERRVSPRWDAPHPGALGPRCTPLNDWCRPALPALSRL